MDVELTFLGAAGNVTGSCTLLRLGEHRILIDCGLFQERALQSRNWEPFFVAPGSVDAVLLTHAHLDHCGRLPKLVKDGFGGKVFCTPATLEIARVLLFDSAYLQEEDMRKKKRRHEKQGKISPFPYEPLYAKEHVEDTVPLFVPAPYATPVKVAPGITARFHEAGHIFGSAMIELTLEQGGEILTVVFSGDVGRLNLPIINDPHQFEHADVLIVESTYGNRTHGTVESIPDELARVIMDTHRRGGNIVIPGFAVERTQEILYHLTGLLREKRIPPLLTFVDSPMAVKVTEIFSKHPELFDPETVELLRNGISPYDFPGLTLSRTVEQSKAINQIRGVAIIIAGSGMCTGGRVKHHLINNISRHESTILFVGYQSPGTLGRQILDGPEEVRIFGEFLPVKAKIEKISGFSGHADHEELQRWMSSIKNVPRQVFVNHGDPESAAALAADLTSSRGWSCTVPEYQVQYKL
ncbi:MBL fold metallo-hydrolase [Myxococcota bacterium]|nr:MBL fold metallo-hydrolase [Myxococcota bacterium]